MRLITIKILEENADREVSNISHSNIFLIYLLKQGKQEKKINEWDYIKLKGFLHSKGNHQQDEKTAHRMGEHIHQ